MMQELEPAQNNAEVVVNENFETLEHQSVYGKRHPTTTGLTWGYYGGRWGDNVAVSEGTLTLSASSTNYVVVARATGVISTSTTSTNWDNTTDYARVYKITTSASAVSGTPEDHRVTTNGILAGGGGGGGGTVDLTSDVTGVLPLANGGTGVALTDPNADRIVFWDDSAGEMAFLTAGTGLSITGTTLSATATGSGDVTGPASSTDNTLPRFDGTTGKALQGSGVAVSDSDEISGYKGHLNLQTGTTYTLVAGDSGKVIDHANAAAITVTLPNSLAVGFCCTYVQSGAGQVSFSAASGATIRNRQTHAKIAGQYGAVTLVVRSNSGGSAAEYVLCGDTAT